MLKFSLPFLKDPSPDLKITPFPGHRAISPSVPPHRTTPLLATFPIERLPAFKDKTLPMEEKLTGIGK
jgi:hypothetical protein